ncbi:hypothetical protein C4K68_08415 [Pokkaliibacter plantistimulans]|uniref:GGDEF-domain containing protein n=1 Tax=Proteobacteria bacterium 228 TaxID=2083153 RepID=A0A2S5KSU0_9PROT|nr:EAL domain-containing protein [Pokkaliibacter plantistimulans]PPC77800.1 hypothetical protein C4K68_08415 [Pokkaliibacter plantistimulans]
MKRIRLLFLYLLAAVFLTASVFSMVNHFRTARLVSNHIQYSAWSLAQLELELQKFYTNIALYGANAIDHNQLMFSYDLLWNRLNVFLVGKENRTLRARFNAEIKIRNLYNTLQDNEQLITDLKAGDKAQQQQLTQQFYPYVQQVRELVMLNFTGKESTKMYEGVLESQQHLAWLLAGLFAVGLTLIITLLRQARRFNRLAHQDPLTGLANRGLFNDSLEASCTNSRQPDSHFALCLIKLNHFKEINHYLGHRQGDELLQKVAQRLREHVRRQDLVARLDGDNFAVILNNLHNDSEALDLARYFRQSLVFDFFIKGRATQIDTSVGVSIFPLHGLQPAELLQAASLALYQAKSAGSTTRVELFRTEMAEHQTRQTTLLLDLKRQLQFCDATSELQLHYLPLYHAADRQLTGIEALLRWQHPHYDAIHPIEIFELAENHGLGMALGNWLFERLEYDYHHSEVRWPENIKVALNLSISMFNPALPSWINQVLQRHVLRPRQLVLELNEATLTQDLQRSAGILKALQDQGIRVALDNFGSGVSSLTTLKALAIDILKLDRSLVQQLSQQQRQQQFVDSIIALCHRLQIQVVAEGVESEEDARCLQAMRCDEIQGFLHSLPLPTSELAPYLQQTRLPAIHTENNPSS